MFATWKRGCRLAHVRTCYGESRYWWSLSRCASTEQVGSRHTLPSDNCCSSGGDDTSKPPPTEMEGTASKRHLRQNHTSSSNMVTPISVNVKSKWHVLEPLMAWGHLVLQVPRPADGERTSCCRLMHLGALEAALANAGGSGGSTNQHSSK